MLRIVTIIFTLSIIGCSNTSTYDFATPGILDVETRAHSVKVTFNQDAWQWSSLSVAYKDMLPRVLEIDRLLDCNAGSEPLISTIAEMTKPEHLSGEGRQSDTDNGLQTAISSFVSVTYTATEVGDAMLVEYRCENQSLASNNAV